MDSQSNRRAGQARPRARAVLWLALCVGLLAAAPAARATSYPDGFAERTLAGGLNSPTAVAWAPDGRMFVAEKSGRVRVVTAAGQLLSTPLIDISSHVNDYWDRGLLGIAVDSDFVHNHYLYLLYVYDSDPMNHTGPKTSRLTRVVVQSNNTVANPSSPEKVLLGTYAMTPCSTPSNGLDCIPAEGGSHSIGTVRSAPDGTLWVGSGDAWNYQFRTYDEQSFAGKIIHVDRDGKGLAGHPFCPSDTNLADVCTKVYAKGFRNPFRFSLRGDGKGPAVGDVGEDSREELDLLQPGKNYGWPCYEGDIKNPAYVDNSGCSSLYAAAGTWSTSISATRAAPARSVRSPTRPATPARSRGPKPRRPRPTRVP